MTDLERYLAFLQRIGFVKLSLSPGLSATLESAK
jgi:hypothetical protein